MSEQAAIEEFAKFLVRSDQRLLTAMRLSVPSKEVQQLAESFVKIFEHEGHTLTVIEHLIVSEIESTVSAGTLFRTNSLASKVMTTWSRLNEGLEFLVSTLSGPINTICSNKYGSLEINPEHVRPDEDVQANISQLISIVQEILELITHSVDRCPLSFRIVCSYLRNHCMQKFPDQSLMAVGGFLILRYFSAALVTPEANGLLEDPPSLDARRILVLVSKTIQNLANRAYFREDFMAPLNAFLDNNAETMARFLDDVSHVPAGAESAVPPPNPVAAEDREAAIVALGDMLARNIRLLEVNFPESDAATKKATMDELRGLLSRLPKPAPDPAAAAAASVQGAEDPKKAKEERKRQEKAQRSLEKKQKELEKQLDKQSKAKREVSLPARRMISLRRSDVRAQLESLYAEQLTAAAAAGNVAAVEELLLRDRRMVNVVDREGQTALMHASSNGHVGVVRALLKAKADCYLPDKRGWSVLHCAAFHNHEEVLLELARQRHIDFTCTNDDDNTALHYFARNPTSKNTETFIKLFLKGGVDINAQNCNMETPLHMAVWKNNPGMVTLLLEYGADPKIENFKRETPYDWATRLNNPEFLAIFDRAIKARAQQSAASGTGRAQPSRGVPGADSAARSKAFIDAVRDGNAEVVRELLRVDRRLADQVFGQQKNTPLHIAATHGHLAITRMLVRATSKIAKNTTGWTPLMCALWQNHPETALAMLLCRHPVDVCAKLEDGNTALHCAAKSDSVPMQTVVWGLCEKGADINAGHLDMTKQLLENGANRQKANKDHETPMDLAQKCGQLAILNVLLDKPPEALAVDAAALLAGDPLSVPPPPPVPAPQPPQLVGAGAGSGPGCSPPPTDGGDQQQQR
eukprot:m51a1_g9229 hypothetical protein (865) ;mRNA; f:74892-78388